MSLQDQKYSTNMKFQGIRRFFESFRNLFTRLRRRPAPEIETVQTEEKTPETPRKFDIPQITKEDLEMVKSEPPLNNIMTKDRIAIKPKKNHPNVRQVDNVRPNHNLTDDGLSDAVSASSSDIIGGYVCPKIEEEEDETEEVHKITSVKIPLKIPIISCRNNSESKIISPPLTDGDVGNGLKPTLRNTSSDASLSSSISVKSSDVFEKQRHPSSGETKLSLTPSVPRKEKVPSRVDSSRSVSRNEVHEDDVPFLKHGSKPSLVESVASVSSSNDQELFFKENTASPTNSEVSLVSLTRNFKSPIPAPRKVNKPDGLISSSESMRLPSSGHKNGSTSSSTNSKSSVSFKDELHKPRSSPEKIVTGVSDPRDEKKVPKFEDDDDDDVVDDGYDDDVVDEVVTISSKSAEVDLLPEIENAESEEIIKTGVFCLKSAEKNSLKYQNPPSFLISDEHKDEDKNDLEEKNFPRFDSQSDGHHGDGDSTHSGDDVSRKPRSPKASESDANPSSKVGTKVENYPDAPKRTKVPPVVPTKPKFNKV